MQSGHLWLFCVCCCGEFSLVQLGLPESDMATLDEDVHRLKV